MFDQKKADAAVAQVESLIENRVLARVLAEEARSIQGGCKHGWFVSFVQPDPNGGYYEGMDYNK